MRQQDEGHCVFSRTTNGLFPFSLHSDHSINLPSLLTLGHSLLWVSEAWDLVNDLKVFHMTLLVDKENKGGRLEGFLSLAFSRTALHQHSRETGTE